MKRLIIIMFALVLVPFVLGESTFMDNTDDFFIMSSAVPTPIVTPIGGGGGGGGGIYAAPECINDSGCELGEFCFENKCYVYECDSDLDCNDTKTCWMNRCVKLFDMKILEVSSPIYPGEFFNFTYFLKGVAAIHGDVIVKFWLVQNGTIVTEGFDTIYMADFDEVTEMTELFLPKDISPGTYNFYAEVEYDSYYARAGRIIEVQEADGEAPEPGFLTGQVIANVGETIKDNVYFVLAAIGIIILFAIAYWERKEIGEVLDIEKKWVNRHKISIGVFLFFVVLSGVLFYANKARMIELSEFHMSFVKILYLVGLIIVGVIVLARARVRNLLDHFARLLKSFFARKRTLEFKTMKLRPQKEIPEIIVVEPKAKPVKLVERRVKERVVHKRIESIHKKVKKILKNKKKGSLKPIVEKWRKKGYDTESLSEKPKILGQGKMKTWLEKWRKRGYDTETINENTPRKGSSKDLKNIERRYGKSE